MENKGKDQEKRRTGGDSSQKKKKDKRELEGKFWGGLTFRGGIKEGYSCDLRTF